MRFPELALLYVLGILMVGLAIHHQGRRDWLTAVIWPLALPGLLAHAHSRFDTVPPGSVDALHEPIARLQHALDLLQVHTDVAPLGVGLADLDTRGQALDALLADPELRPENREALRALHGRITEERQATLDRIDDLVTTIHLAHYGGRPLSGIDEQLADLLAMVRGVAEVRAIP